MPTPPEVAIKESMWVSKCGHRTPSPGLPTVRAAANNEDHMSDGGRSRTGSHSRGDGVCGENNPRNETHRWLSIPEQSPVDLGEPFMLLNFTRPTLTPESCVLVLVEQFDDGVLARPKVQPNMHRQLIV